MAPFLYWLHRTARFLTILCPLLIVAGPAPGDVAASIIAIFFLLHSALTRNWQWLQTRWVQLLLVLWVYMCARNLLLPETHAVLRSASWLRFPIFAAALAFWILPDAGTRDWLRKTLIAAVAFLAFDTLLQYATGSDLLGRESFPYQGGLRLTGPFGNPRVGVTILWLMFPAIFWCVGHAAPRIKVAGALLGIAAALAVFASGERMALLLMIISFGAALLFLPRARYAMLLVAVVGLSIGWFMTHNNPKLQQRQVNATKEEVTAFGESAYGQTWKSSLHIGMAHPLIGIGSKQFQPVCKQPAYGATDDYSLRQRCPMHPHNLYLEWLVEYGLIGLGLFIAAVICWGRLALTGWHVWWKEPLTTGLLITMGARLWPVSVVTSQFVSWSAVPFWLIAGWLLAVLFVGKPTTSNNNA